MGRIYANPEGKLAGPDWLCTVSVRYKWACGHISDDELLAFAMLLDFERFARNDLSYGRHGTKLAIEFVYKGENLEVAW